MIRFAKISFFCFLSILMITGIPYASDKGYPTQPITLIIPAAPGGVMDLGARFLVEDLSEYLGQPVIPTNKPGGGNYIGGNAVATAKPDGYTIGTLSVTAIMPEVFTYFREAPYTSADLKPICRIMDYVGVVIVKADATWNSLEEVVEHARKNPGMKFGVTAVGGWPDLVMKAIAQTKKVQFVGLPEEGDSKVVMNILGGHIPVAIVAYASAKAQLSAGALKILAVGTPKRFELLPHVPTLAELGYVAPYDAHQGLFAPKDTPDSIIEKINEAVKKVKEKGLYSQKLMSIGSPFIYESTDQYRETLNRHKVQLKDYLTKFGYVKK